MKRNEDRLLSASSKTDEDFGLVSTYLGIFPLGYTIVIDFQLNSTVIRECTLYDFSTFFFEFLNFILFIFYTAGSY